MSYGCYLFSNTDVSAGSVLEFYHIGRYSVLAIATFTLMHLAVTFIQSWLHFSQLAIDQGQAPIEQRKVQWQTGFEPTTSKATAH